MHFNLDDINIYVIVLVTFISSLVLVPLMKVLSKHVGAIDIPGGRKVHTKPMPRMGGLAIFLSFLIGVMLFGEITKQMMGILIGGFIIVLLGIFDDIKPISAKYKLIAQIASASIVVLYGNIYLPEMGAFGININFGNFGYPVAIIFIVAISNAINLIDGLDGLAAGISSIYYITIAVIAILFNKAIGVDIILTLVMLGSTLGFLVYNFNPASIFMGDSGSLFLGYTISIIALLGYKAATFTSLFIPLLILFIPIIDTLFAIIRRLLKGEKMGVADKEHFHHQLLKLNKCTKKTVLTMYGISILCSSISIFYLLGNNKLAIGLYLLLMVSLLLLIFKTEIIFKKR